MRAALLLASWMLLVAMTPMASAPGRTIEHPLATAGAGVALPGERVLLAQGGLLGNIVDWVLLGSVEGARADIITQHCSFFWCTEDRRPAMAVGHEWLRGYLLGGPDRLYLEAADLPVAYAVGGSPRLFAVEVCPTPPETDLCWRD